MADIHTCGTTTRIVATLVCVAGVLLIGCSDNATTSPPPYTPPPTPGSIHVLAFATYDGSGQAVHPDAVTTPDGWGTSSSHLVVTPYPEGQAAFENPSVYTGQSLTAWQVPQGVQNPIARPVATGYLSDPDELYNPSTSELWLYYRQVTTTNQILLLRSPDGVQWETPVTVLSVPNHQAISPTVVRKSANDWWLWTVNAGADGCSSASTTVEVRRSTDGIHWSDPQTVQLGVSGDFPWHLDVIWVPEQGEFWALYNAKTAGSCTTAVLRFAVSQDGVHWTTEPTPLLTKGVIPEFADVVYRSSLEYDAARDLATLWYSGARYTNARYVWHIAVQQMSRTALFAIVTQTPPPLSSKKDVTPSVPGPPTVAPPPLTNATAP